jgi:hypothetical protein
MPHAHFIRVLGSWTLLAAIATSSQSAIFGRDDRLYVSPAAGSPYSPVGLVVAGSLLERRTTGFLVDECHVLTSEAAALGYGESPLGRRARFIGGLGTRQRVSSQGTVVAVGGAVRIRSSAEQFKVGGRDWLLLHLDKCVGATLGYVTLKTGPFSPYEFRNLESAGYPTGRSIHSGLTLDPSCQLLANYGTVWGNDCAMARGDAGDPIFRLSTLTGKPRLEVYAMQSAGYLRKEPVSMVPGYANQAVPMSLIASQITPYLTANSHQPGSRGGTARSERADAIPHVSGSAGVPSGRHLLDPRLDTSHR